MSEIKLFISHSSKDQVLVEHLVDYLTSSLDIKDGDMVCTSHEEFRLRAGNDPSFILAKMLREAKKTLCVITPHYLNAAWPVAEMGAAWGLEREPIALLGGGLNRKLLEGPLDKTIVLYMDRAKDLIQLIKDVSESTLIDILPSTDYENHAKQLAKFSVVLQRNAYLPERLIFRKHIKDQEQGMRWADLEKTCSSELLIWGWSCGNVLSLKTRDVFKALLDNGKSVRFLILNPDAVQNSSLILEPVCHLDGMNTVAMDIKKSKDNLIDFASRLTTPQRTNLEIKETSWLMTWSGLAIDPNADDGLIQVEHYHYNNPYNDADHLDKRPIQIIKKNSVYFDGYWNSIEAMYKASSVV